MKKFINEKNDALAESLREFGSAYADIERRLAGNYVTSLDMADCSRTLALIDGESSSTGMRRC